MLKVVLIWKVLRVTNVLTKAKTLKKYSFVANQFYKTAHNAMPYCNYIMLLLVFESFFYVPQNTHNEIGANSHSIDCTTIQTIDEMFNNNIKPKDILFRLTSSSTTSITLNQIKNYLSQLRKGKQREPNINCELEAIPLTKNAIPDDPTAVYVVEVEYKVFDKVKPNFAT